MHSRAILHLRSYTTKTAVPLTATRFPSIKRNPAFKTLDSNDIAAFKKILPDETSVVDGTDPDALLPFNQDWMRKFRGQSQLVLKPKTSHQVSQLLKYCNDHRIGVVPQGGNTGLVGGSVPVHDEVVLSTQAMNRIRAFDQESGILTCEAGCILESLDHMLAEKGYMMPLDLGAKGSCHIGGNLATNAGGLRLLRYGSLHGTVLSMEVVLADGTIVELGKPLRKDNTGYDLKQLFIGSEGTLGIITAASILTPLKPKAVNVAVLGVSSYESVQKLFQEARGHLSEILSAFEFFDASCMALVQKHIATSRLPFDTAAQFYVLIETSGSNKDHDDEKLTTFLDSVMEKGWVVDGTVAQDATQVAAFWSIRESITEACAKEGPNYKYDLSVPLPKLYGLVTDMRQHLSQVGVMTDSMSGKPFVKQVVGFGHVGDGNLHLNVIASEWSKDIERAIEPKVYNLVQTAYGSVSAEHGIGLSKTIYLSHSKTKDAIAMMRSLKQTFDPKGILNPYKYFPNKE
ncbi:D-lactate ferricytochrome c oxidoreductase [Batrachochytrium dendrobatidis]|nr:D-lactate ferricytochrome c oxidoreductase [Batrachochytrium dendrobatidis]